MIKGIEEGRGGIFFSHYWKEMYFYKLDVMNFKVFLHADFTSKIVHSKIIANRI